MKNPQQFLPSTRREFFRITSRGIGLLAFSRFAPSFLVQSTLAETPPPEKDRAILVLVQLAGGNDGLNTLVPYEDANYYRLRPTLGLPKDQILKIENSMLGLHPACAAMSGLLKDGKLAIVQNVGYPNPNRSHFRSTEIWETASDSSEYLATGWIGRFMDNTCHGSPAADSASGLSDKALATSEALAKEDPCAVHITTGVPQSFLAEHDHNTFGLDPNSNFHRRRENLQLLEKLVDHPGEAENASATFLKHTMMDALVTEKRVQQVLGNYRPAAAYPNTPFAASLHNVAALIAANLSTRIYFVSLSGFDTHANQVGTQANLLRTLSEGLAAFQKDLEAHKLDRQVVTMTFSEFGRRASENQSKGTDHGTAAPLFVMGSRVKAGLHGAAPSLDLPKNQDLTFSTDFRQVYATVLDRWLNCADTAVLGKAYEPLGFIA